MTNSTTQITTQQQPPLVESSSSSASESPKNPFVPFFPNFNFNFQLPHFFLPPKKHQQDDGGDKNKATSIIPKLQEEGGGHAPNVVTFPKTQLAVVSEPLQAESETSSTKTSNPLVLYQVYAVGAFFISRWIWARWNERKARGRSSDEDGEGDGRGSLDNE